MAAPVTVNARWRRASTSASASKDGLALTAPFHSRWTARTTKTMTMVSGKNFQRRFLEVAKYNKNSNSKDPTKNWVEYCNPSSFTNYAKHSTEAVPNWVIRIQFKLPNKHLCVRYLHSSVVPSRKCQNLSHFPFLEGILFDDLKAGHEGSCECVNRD